ncbi:hypothetical protein ONZ51_g1752 [Trametes cubensis]|uniref:Uncharacterized protein n=1 Tax=Trametes cubensis TaxID=1111947 RepID=A0AAD7XFH1_9APHY|nr:hypothetical protein ONZ51_g1752 [Trametes cubensis]
MVPPPPPTHGQPLPVFTQFWDEDIAVGTFPQIIAHLVGEPQTLGVDEKHIYIEQQDSQRPDSEPDKVAATVIADPEQITLTPAIHIFR